MKLRTLILPLFLVGCGTAQYSNQPNVHQIYASELETLYSQCRYDFENDVALDPIKNYIPYNPLEATISQRSNNKKPTNKEKKAVDELDIVRTKCLQGRIQLAVKYKEQAGRQLIQQNHLNAYRYLTAELWAGKMSYGEYINKVISLNSRRDELIAQYDLEAQKAATEQQRQAAESAARVKLMKSQADAQKMQALGNYLQMIQPQPSNSKSTTCTTFGNMMTCQ